MPFEKACSKQYNFIRRSPNSVLYVQTENQFVQQFLFQMGRKSENWGMKDPNYIPYERTIRKSTRLADLDQKYNKDFWKKQQQQKYLQFLKSSKHYFVSKESRIFNKVFRNMSEFLMTRSPCQCRSHHQKMEGKYGNTNQIIDGVTKDRIQNQQFYIQKFKANSNQSNEGNNIKIEFIQENQEVELFEKDDRVSQTDHEASNDFKKEQKNVKIENQQICKEEEQNIYKIRIEQKSVWKFLDRLF